MASIVPQTFQTLLQNAATAVQGTARQLLDFTVGSILRAVLEATSAMALWLQGIALQIASLTRFSTSSGADADSWGADFDFPRLPAQAATGPVTLARFTSTTQATVAVGVLVQTQDGKQQFEVIPDVTQPTYNPTLAVYVLAPTVPSITATVQAVVSSSAGNVGAGFINQFASTIPGIDTVTNLLPFANGADEENDPAYRARFVLYIQSLAQGTVAAVNAAIESVQQGVVNAITENQDFNGDPDPGNFYAVVDDGSGNPSTPFLSTVSNAIDAARPIGSTFQVFGPTVVGATITMSLTVALGYNLATVDGIVAQALQAYLSSLTIGEDLPYTRLAQIAYDASPGVTNVTSVLLNGGTSDLVATNQQVVRAASITVS